MQLPQDDGSESEEEIFLQNEAGGKQEGPKAKTPLLKLSHSPSGTEGGVERGAETGKGEKTSNKFKNTRQGINVTYRGNPNLSDASFCHFVQGFLFLLITISILIFAIYIFIARPCWSLIDNYKPCHRTKAAWEVTFTETGSRSSLRVVDVDGDGANDILLPYFISEPPKHTTTSLSTETMTTETPTAANITHTSIPTSALPPATAKTTTPLDEENIPSFRQGGVLALSGKDGSVLWRREWPFPLQPLSLLCYGQTPRCLVTGAGGEGTRATSGGTGTTSGQTSATSGETGATEGGEAHNPLLASLLPRENGREEWDVTEQSGLEPGATLYQGQIVMDVDEDGVGEIVVVAGGDNQDGKLILISPTSGDLIGNPVPMFPNSTGTTHTGVLVYDRHVDGATIQYIIYTTGSETQPGGVYALSLASLYRLCHGLTPETTITPNIDPRPEAQRQPWHDKKPDSRGVFQLLESTRLGITESPIIVDLDGDGVDEIIISLRGGFVAKVRLDTLEKVWEAELHLGVDTVSSASPLYFTNDDVLDLAVNTYQGTFVLDGASGDIIWSLTSGVSLPAPPKSHDAHQPVPLILRSEGEFLDALISTVTLASNNSEARRPRDKRCDGHELQETFTIFVDRTLCRRPIVLLNHTNNFEENSNSKDCDEVLQQWKSTGALADTDGDGSLDYVHVTLLTTAVNSDDQTSLAIQKMNLVKLLRIESFMHLSTDYLSYIYTRSDLIKYSRQSDTVTRKYKTIEDQTWNQYLGYNTTGIYYNNT